MPNFEYEERLYNEGYTSVCGCDEAGRGPLCGPVVAAAVILPLGIEIEGLNDSKKLTEKKREKLFDIIKEKAIAYAIAEASPEEIDEINILNASMLAMILCTRMMVVARDAFMTRYKLTEDEVDGLDSYDLFELVGRKRGFLISGGQVNHQRCAEMLLDEFRGGKIGRITLDLP